MEDVDAAATVNITDAAVRLSEHRNVRNAVHMHFSQLY